jgi:hypothetical protein
MSDDALISELTRRFPNDPPARTATRDELEVLANRVVRSTDDEKEVIKAYLTVLRQPPPSRDTLNKVADLVLKDADVKVDTTPRTLNTMQCGFDMSLSDMEEFAHAIDTLRKCRPSSPLKLSDIEDVSVDNSPPSPFKLSDVSVDNGGFEEFNDQLKSMLDSISVVWNVDLESTDDGYIGLCSIGL